MRHLLRIAVHVPAALFLMYGARAAEQDRWSNGAPLLLRAIRSRSAWPNPGRILTRVSPASVDPTWSASASAAGRQLSTWGNASASPVPPGESVLERQLGRISDRAPSDLWEKIAASQRAWEEWSASDCEALASPYEGGTIHSLTIGRCLLRHVGARALQIEALADDIDR
jgi:hypothetical protein